MTATDSSLSLAQRVVRKFDYIPCAEAFVDTRLPNRDGKLNYCIIGPGVAENSKQHINIVEPHGFNVGGVSLPTGKYNSLHSHETAEVFLVCRGDWRFFWGHDGKDGEVIVHPGDTITIPVGCFRAFESVGSDDNFMISYLGEDDPGCVTWENAVIEGAAEFGFYLTKDAKLIDTTSGQALPEDDMLMKPLSTNELESFKHFTTEQMLARIYNVANETGFTGVFADESKSGGAKVYHPIIGPGFGELIQPEPRVTNPHSFSVSAIVADPNHGFLPHTVNAKQVLVIESGTWSFTMSEGEDSITTELTAEDTVSIPANAIRHITNVGSEQGVMHFVTSGDNAAHISWV